MSCSPQIAAVLSAFKELLKNAVGKKQEFFGQFLDFIKNDDHFKKYYDGIYILFHTGLRILEFTGLTVSDIDFEKGRTMWIPDPED